MKRPLQVKQRESDYGEYWYTVSRGNGSTMLTSETYPTRDGALRAARGFIAAIDPVQVLFSYWAGQRPPYTDEFRGGAPRLVTEQIRG